MLTKYLEFLEQYLNRDRELLVNQQNLAVECLLGFDKNYYYWSFLWKLALESYWGQQEKAQNDFE